eukprot:PhM_4_TR17430/c1_g2_i1/m.25287
MGCCSAKICASTYDDVSAHPTSILELPAMSSEDDNMNATMNSSSAGPPSRKHSHSQSRIVSPSASISEFDPTKLCVLIPNNNDSDSSSGYGPWGKLNANGALDNNDEASEVWEDECCFMPIAVEDTDSAERHMRLMYDAMFNEDDTSAHHVVTGTTLDASSVISASSINTWMPLSMSANRGVNSTFYRLPTLLGSSLNLKAPVTAAGTPPSGPLAAPVSDMSDLMLSDGVETPPAGGVVAPQTPPPPSMLASAIRIDLEAWQGTASPNKSRIGTVLELNANVSAEVSDVVTRRHGGELLEYAVLMMEAPAATTTIGGGTQMVFETAVDVRKNHLYTLCVVSTPSNGAATSAAIARTKHTLSRRLRHPSLLRIVDVFDDTEAHCEKTAPRSDGDETAVKRRHLYVLCEYHTRENSCGLAFDLAAVLSGPVVDTTGNLFLLRRVCYDLIHALQFLHTHNVCHGNLTQQSVIVAPASTSNDADGLTLAKLADYGLYFLSSDASDDVPLLMKKDIYDLGVVMQEMVSAKASPPPDAVLAEVLAWMTHETPSMRPSASEVLGHAFFNPRGCHRLDVAVKLRKMEGISKKINRKQLVLPPLI